MENKLSVNLIQSREAGASNVFGYLPFLRRLSYFVIAGVLVLGLIVGAGYLWASTTSFNLTSIQTNLLVQLDSQNQKAVMLGAMKNRLDLIAGVIKGEKDWGKILTLVHTIAAPPVLQSLVVSEQFKVLITLKLASLSDAGRLYATLMDLAGQRKIVQLVLVSLQIDKDNGIQMSFSFIPGA